MRTHNRKVKRDNIVYNLFKYTMIVVLTVVMLFPFYWMFISAFKSSNEIYQMPPLLWPSSWNFSNITKALASTHVENYFLNSVIVAFTSTVLTTVITIFAAFALVLTEKKIRTAILKMLIALMFIPFELLILVNYTTTIAIGIFNTHLALIIPFLANISYLVVLTRKFEQFPRSYYISARIDGISNWKYLWRVLVPNSLSTITVIILLNTISSWNSFAWPKYVITDERIRTLPFGLYMLVTETSSNTELIMAASIIFVLPMILMYFLLKKHIIKGFRGNW